MGTKKFIFSLIAAFASIAAFSASAQTSVMRYNIVYKWGFIEKVAGHGTVRLAMNGNQLHATLDGHSIPWGGRLYSVADTLVTSFTQSGNSFVQNVSYRNGWYTKPEAGAPTADLLASPANYRTINGKGTLDASDATMEAVTITCDMLGFFHLAQVINFDALKPGSTLTVPIHYTNGNSEQVRITYNGTLERPTGKAYDVVFNYSYRGQLSGYPVQTVVDADSRVVLSAASHLLIGDLEMVYVP